MKTKRFYPLPLILCMIIFISAATGPVYAQDGGFEEDFTEPGAPDWELIGESIIRDGVLAISDGGKAQYRAGFSSLEVSILLRISGPGEFLLHYGEGEKSLDLLVSGTYFALAENGVPLAELPIENIAEGDWFHVLYSVNKHFIHLEINGQVYHHQDQIDGHPIGPFSLGYFGPGSVEIDFIEGGGELITFAPDEEKEDKDSGEGSDQEPSESPADQPYSGDAAYLAESWAHLGGPIGGLGYDIRYSFADHQTWYVTDAWAGIHRSRDGGLTWEPINEGITARKGVDGVPIFTVVVDHHDPSIIWVGTETTGQIYRSGDEGDTWVEMSNGIDKSLRPLTFRGITIHPEDQNIMYAMAEISSAAWTPDGEPRVGFELDLTKGIVYKTTNGGMDWVEVWRGDNLARYAWINPENPEIVYVSTGIFDRESATTDTQARYAGGIGILKTIDGGKNWQVINEDQGLLDRFIGSLYMHPEDPDILLAAGSQNNWSGLEENHTMGVYLTEDGGESWKRVINQPEMFGTVEICVSDPRIAYAGTGAAVYRSDDGGHTWERYGRPDNTWGAPGVIAGIPIDMQCDPENPDRLFVNNYGGGNFLTEDGAKTWINASKGYSGALVRQVVIAPGETGWVYAGARSGVFRSQDGGENWQGTANSSDDLPATTMVETTALAVHPEKPSWILTSAGDLPITILSKDGGESWEQADGFVGAPAALAFSPSDPNIVYGAITYDKCSFDEEVGALWDEICKDAVNLILRSDDAGQSWNIIDLEKVPGIGFTAMAVHQEKPETLFATTLSGGFLKSEDGGKHWTGDDPVPLSRAIARSFAIDPQDQDHILVGFDEGGLLATDDGGKNWYPISAGLAPEAAITSIVFDSVNPGVVYLADKLSGVFYSIDGGSSWKSLNQGLTHKTATSLDISDDGTVLYVGIEGAGVYRLGSPRPVSEKELITTSDADGDMIEGDDREQGQEMDQQGGEQSADESSQDQDLPVCPTSYFPFLVAVALVGLRRKRIEKA